MFTLTPQNLAAVVQGAIERSGLTRKELADKAGIDPSNLSTTLNSGRISIDMANRIAAALGQRLHFRLSPIRSGS